MRDRSALNPHPLVVAASRRLLARVDEIAEHIAGVIEKEEPAYGSGDLLTHEDVRAGNRRNLEAILSQLSGVHGPGLAAPRETGRLRAEQSVPLAAVLRAYRIGTAVLWQELVESAGDDPDTERALLVLATDVWNLVDDYSQALTEAYQETVAERARRDTLAREAALDALLAGAVADGSRLLEAAAILRLPHHGAFAVVVAGDPEAVPGIEGTLAARGVRSAWRVERDGLIGVVALTERVPIDELCSYLRAHATGRVGVSPLYQSLDATHSAARQARLAVSAATAEEGLVRYDRALLEVLLASASEVAAELVASVLGPVLALPGRERTVLLETVQAWYRSDGEPSATATALHCHRNTIRYRLNRFTELTGRNLSAPAEAAEIYLALQALRIRTGA